MYDLLTRIVTVLLRRKESVSMHITYRRALVALLVLVASLAFAAPALAKEPTGDFAVFKQCPRFSGANFCIFSQITGGEVAIGSTVVPIKNTITLQGGYFRNEEKEPVTETFSGALNGETLSKTAQPVPGGLLDLINCNEIKGEFLLEKAARAACKAVFENALTGVNAVTELAKPASAIGISTDNLFNEEGVALSLPAKVHLENPFLGSECYIGSSATPVTLNLTTGTTKPPAPNKAIKGKTGEVKFKDELELIEVSGTSLVDNAFAVPVAEGCGGIFSFLIDPLVDAKLGLPSAAGHNTAIQNGSEKLATAERVIASEK
jgi:hypothetical protein